MHKQNQIQIVAYDPAWPALFAAESERISIAMGKLAERIDHVGSNAVAGLAAKPVIDIQISVKSLASLDPYAEVLTQLGYLHIPLQPGDSVYPFFQRPNEWPCTHHVHFACIALSMSGVILPFETI